MNKISTQSICLKCKKKMPFLKQSDTGTYFCDCGRNYHYRRGIYIFVKSDNFYEGKFTKTFNSGYRRIKYIKKIIYYISLSGNEERVWRKAIKIIKGRNTGSKMNILNVGAGGGHSFLKELGSVTSVDLSFRSLINAQNVSEACYQADVCQLPFEDESFDLVFSAHVLGHIPLNKKQRAIEEIFRVTKKRGFSLHSAECEANNFVYCRAKKYPELYLKYFKEMYGHFGIELPSRIKSRFRLVGFKSIFEKSDYCKGIIRPSASYKVFFCKKEFWSKEILFSILSFLSKVLSCNKTFEVISDIFFYPLSIVNRAGGEDSVDSVKLLYQKPTA